MRTESTAARRAVTSIFLLVLVTIAVAVGLRQDRDLAPAGEGETGVVEQVLPASEQLASLSTAPEVGALAPNFRLRTADGELVELADLRGTPVFINFWASWCFFCLTEMPAIQKVSDGYGDEVTMMGVNVSDSPEDIALYA
ncbi:MAG TPA: redoxin domain-containing protein, partial [Thermomicrobiales bacterium]|nr:redoxin domain-containing protein [Thermomicrobiales bacterium]